MSAIQPLDSFSIQPRAWASLAKAETLSLWPLGQVTSTNHSEKMPNWRGVILGSLSDMGCYSVRFTNRYGS